MSIADYERILEAAKSLTPDERQRLRDEMVSLPSSSQGALTEDEFEQEMLREGILDHVPPPIDNPSEFLDWEPISIEGKPLSESIIEERR